MDDSLIETSDAGSEDGVAGNRQTSAQLEPSECGGEVSDTGLTEPAGAAGPGGVAGCVADEGTAGLLENMFGGAAYGGVAGVAGRAGFTSDDDSPPGSGIAGYGGVAGEAGLGCSAAPSAPGGGGGRAPACGPGFFAELDDHITSPTTITSAATPPTPAIRPIGSERSSSVGVLSLASAAAADGDMVGSAEPAPAADFGFSGAGSDAGVT
jgi:hypothetical protein